MASGDAAHERVHHGAQATPGERKIDLAGKQVGPVFDASLFGAGGLQHFDPRQQLVGVAAGA
jgi:hypothetical protein